MAIVRNIDVTMQSEVSFDDACRAAVAEAAKTLRGIMSFRVKEAECVVEHDKVIAYRVTGKIVFLVERCPVHGWSELDNQGSDSRSVFGLEWAGPIVRQ